MKKFLILFLLFFFFLILLLRFSPSSGLGFLALLPPIFSLPCYRLLVVQNPSYINVPATQISAFCQNIYFCVFILFLCVHNLYLYFHHVCVIKSGALSPRARLKFLGPLQVHGPYFDSSVTHRWLSSNT